MLLASRSPPPAILSADLMHRIALGLAVWSLLLLVIAGLAALARPASGPPMPRDEAMRATVDALVPVADVKPARTPRDLLPGEMSGTVAPRVPIDAKLPDPSATETAAPETAAPETTEPSTPVAGQRPTRPRSGEAGIPGLGALPAGVPAEEEGFGLHILRADGRPALDANVRWMLQRDLDAVRASGRDPSAMHPSDLLAEATRTVRTLAGGFAMLTSEAGTMIMDARLGDEYGSAVVQREDVSHRRIVLARDTTLAVRVDDALGAARSGVPVLLRSADCRTIWSSRTGADGVATLRFADGAILAASARHDELTVAVDVPGDACIVLPAGLIPAEIVRLVTPPGKRVLVWVHGADGQPCASESVVTLAPAGREGDCRVERRRTVVDGLAVFEDLPAGMDLVAIARTRCSPLELRADVRTTDQDETSVVLAATSPMPRVSGRLLDPRGNPWRSFDVVAWTILGGAWSEQGAERTDDRGAFVIDVPALHAAERAVELVLVARNPYGRTVASTTMSVEPRTARNPLDLGDVLAPDWPVLIRGSVLDENERPIELATVELCDARAVADPRTRVEADERGAFTLRGPAPADDALLVRAVEPERRAAEATLALRRGDSRARVVIAVHGSLRGHVVLPLGAPEGSVIVRVERANGAALALSTDGTSSFGFSNVDAGEVRVIFHPVGFEEPLLVLERVLVPRGAASVDTRLAHVDLTDRATVLELEIVDERGQPMESASIGPVTSETSRPHGRPLDIVDGVVRILVPRGIAAIQVSAQAYEPVILTTPSGRVRVELKLAGG